MDRSWIESRIAETEDLLRAGAERLQQQRDTLARDRLKGDALVIETTEKIVAVLTEIQSQRESELVHLLHALDGKSREPLAAQGWVRPAAHVDNQPSETPPRNRPGPVNDGPRKVQRSA
jgi:hypothetical protein